jgi:futalosine hydrolase
VTHRLLVVTAVAAEADAVRAGLSDSRGTTGRGMSGGAPGAPAIVVTPVGVGPAAAAAATARLLAIDGYGAVISAGIAGGFPGRAEVGATVIGRRSIAADLGAESPDGFLPIDALGFGTAVVHADPGLVRALTAALPEAVVGDILTVATVTGTGETAARLAAVHPEAVAEAMEGHGVATAAAQAGIPFAELRTVSNPVGPRDREAWRLKEAFAALTTASTALWTELWTTSRGPS